MQRIDRARLDAARGIVFEVATRFDDLDVQGHVNNAAAVVILQEARVQFNRAMEEAARQGGLRVLVAALAIEYAGEMRHPGAIEVTTALLSIGRTSLTIGQVGRQDGVARLYAEAVVVLADADGPTPIPDDLRDAYAGQLIG